MMDCTIARRNRQASDYPQAYQRDRLTQWATAALQVCFSCGFLKLYYLLEGKVGIISNRLDALINCQVCVQLYPLARIAHEREMKTLVPAQQLKIHFIN